MEELRRKNPSLPIYVSVSTVAGRAVAEKKLASQVDGIFYAPLDYSFAVRRVIETIRPAVLAVLETEIWPTLYREVKRARCSLLVLNGRISDRAFPRYRRLAFFFQPVLALPDALLTQTESDRERYARIGAPSDKLRTFGNLKYDAAAAPAPPPAMVSALLRKLQPAHVWVAASTMPGIDAADVDEDDVVINAFQELAPQFPGLLLILVPRRPERFDLADQKLRAAGVPFVRRSQESASADLALPCVLLLDSMGELSTLFPLATVVFMGGTLAQRGGHNVLEPAVCARSIIVGPHMENFSAIATDFRAHQAWLEIASQRDLAGAVASLLDDDAARQQLGLRAAELSQRNTGVAARAADEILRLHDLAVPKWDRPGLSLALLWPLSRLWMLGNCWKQRRDVNRAQRLDRPVVSVGGISMGGSGKTPLVEFLATAFRRKGMWPAILTRGYHRRSLEAAILIRAGAAVSNDITGDEAQVFVRAGMAHVGIGADRWSTGQMAVQQFPVDLFLLDDGFQHRRLKRDLDIVLIDALDPFPGGVFPLGRMREPLSGLARADVFVITRARPLRNYHGIRGVLGSVNPQAPVFLARVGSKHWIRERTQEIWGVPPSPVAAFCGLGNPATFWHTLQEQNFEPALTWVFDDHHRYSALQMRRLAFQARTHGAKALLTTEKDAMNLPENASALVEPLEIYWLKIETVLENELALLQIIESKLN